MNINDGTGPLLNRKPALHNSCDQTRYCKPDDIGEGRQGWPQASHGRYSSAPGTSVSLCPTRSPNIHLWSSPLSSAKSFRTKFSPHFLTLFFHFTRRFLTKKFKRSRSMHNQWTDKGTTAGRHAFLWYAEKAAHWLRPLDENPKCWAASQDSTSCHAFVKEWIECAHGIGGMCAEKECKLECAGFVECLLWQETKEWLNTIMRKHDELIKEGQCMPPPHHLGKEDPRPWAEQLPVAGGWFSCLFISTGKFMYWQPLCERV